MPRPCGRSKSGSWNGNMRGGELREQEKETGASSGQTFLDIIKYSDFTGKTGEL